MNDHIEVVMIQMMVMIMIMMIIMEGNSPTSWLFSSCFGIFVKDGCDHISLIYDDLMMIML